MVGILFHAWNKRGLTVEKSNLKLVDETENRNGVAENHKHNANKNMFSSKATTNFTGRKI